MSKLPEDLKDLCEANGVSAEALGNFFEWFKSQFDENEEVRQQFALNPGLVIEQGMKAYHAQMKAYYEKLLSDTDEGRAMFKKLAGEVYDELNRK